MMGEWLLALEAAIQDAQDAGESAARRRQRAARLRDQLARHGRQLGVPALPDDDAFDRARSAIRQRLDPAAEAPLRARSRSRSTRAPPAARCATRSRSSSASWRRCSPRPGRATSSTGRSARPAARACSTSATSRRCATSSPAASRRSGARCASGPTASRRTARASRRWSPTPPSHKWERVSNDDIGEPGCKYWHSTPRLGLVGMLMGWWRVKISSGCP